MFNFNLLLDESLLTCNKCGACREVCPVFDQIGREPAVTRGRMALLESLIKKEIEPSEELTLPFSQCLLCLACTKVCATQIPILQLIPLARAYLKGKLGQSRVERFFFRHLLQSKALMNGLLTGSSILQPIFARKIPQDSGLHLRLSFYIDSQRRLPSLADSWLSSELAAVNMARREKERVAFFSGCMINYIYPEVGFNLVNTLNRAGITVVFPKDQKCCGCPVYVNGDLENAYKLARDWVKTFSSLRDVQAIVTACASCGAALRDTFYHLLKPDLWVEEKPAERILIKEIWEKYGAIRPKLMDISQFLVRYLSSSQIFPSLANYSRVAYHDPCHLLRVLGVHKEPRQLLGKMAGQRLVELSTSSGCCGGGGTFSLHHYQLSRQINRKRIEEIKKSQADLLVTNCPLCKAHLLDGCYQEKLEIQVVHLLDLFKER